jgi:hypothetical protein
MKTILSFYEGMPVEMKASQNYFINLLKKSLKEKNIEFSNSSL